MSNKEFEAARALAELDGESLRQLEAVKVRIDCLETNNAELERRQRATEQQLHELATFVGAPRFSGGPDRGLPGLPSGGPLHA